MVLQADTFVARKSFKKICFFFRSLLFFYLLLLTQNRTGIVEKTFDILTIIKKALVAAFSFGMSNPVSFSLVTISNRTVKSVSTQEQVWRWRWRNW